MDPRELLHKTRDIQASEIAELDSLIRQFPYFQALHILRAKAAANSGTVSFNRYLKLASLYAGDRKALYQFIQNISGNEAIKEEPSVSPTSALSEAGIPEQPLRVPVAIHYPFEPGDEKPLTLAPVERRATFQPAGPPETTSEPISDLADQGPLTERSPAVFVPEEIPPTHQENSMPPALEPAVETPEEPEIIHEETVPLTTQADEITSDHIPAVTDRSVPETEPGQGDFLFWLDHFTEPGQVKVIQDHFITKPEDIPSQEPQAIEPSDLSENEFPVEYNDRGEIIFSEEAEDEALDDPVNLAEMAYDIQAFVKSQNRDEAPAPEKKADKADIDALLDRFIQNNPSISKPKKEFYKPENMAKKSEEFHADIVTESLANLFYKQGHLHQALEIYEKLILQKPNKKDIFAARILEIKEELINRL